MHRNGENQCWVQTVTPELGTQIRITVAHGGCEDVVPGTFKGRQCPAGILDQAGKTGFGGGGVATRGTSRGLWLPLATENVKCRR